jgi:endoglucanase
LKRLAALMLSPFALAAALHADSPVLSPDIRVNSIGYLPAWGKRASVLNAAPGAVWRLRRAADGQIADHGALPAALADPDTGEAVSCADFSRHQQGGSYYLEVTGLGRSAPFDIQAGAYRPALGAAMLGFYAWRCGSAVSFDWQGQHYGHAACHLDDGHLDRLGRPGERRDATGGWHDAGDYNKYVVNAGVSVGCLLQAWEDFQPGLAALPLPFIPEHGGPLPDYLAELKWELDWVLKMQYGPKDGRASHKLSATGFDPFELPELELSPRYFVPYSSAATADAAAMLAKAARIYAPYDAAYAARCGEAARLGWKALLEEPADRPADQAGFSTGGYGIPQPGARLWAAAERWELDGDAAALELLQRLLRAEPALCDDDWDWGSQKNLGVFTYINSARPGRDPALLAAVKQAVLAAADARVDGWKASGFGRSLPGRYYWGSNGSVARAALVLAAAQRLSGERRYLEAAVDQAAYLFGRNQYNRSQVTGLGLNPPLHPHHRPSGGDKVEAPWPGYLVGGGRSASDWTDEQGDYRTNEVAINWNAALVYLLALCDQLPGSPPPGHPAPGPTPAPAP